MRRAQPEAEALMLHTNDSQRNAVRVVVEVNVHAMDLITTPQRQLSNAPIRVRRARRSDL